jgi:dihydrofolate reductase
MATIIVACDENNLIGDGDKLPWNIPEDLKWFKETTIDHVIIMGKNTWNSLPRKPLPKRINCIISRNQTYDRVSLFDLDVEWYTDIKIALKANISYFNGTKKCFIIGGEQIYKAALKLEEVDEILLTRIKGTFKGDKYFPQLDSSEWQEESIIRETDQFKIIRYTRIKNDNSSSK